MQDYLILEKVLPAGSISIHTRGEERPIAISGSADLPPDQCELDAAHSMNRRVVIRAQERGLAAVAADIFPSPVVSAQISVWYRPADSEEPFRELEDGMTLHSGDQIRVFVASERPVHAYIFHHSSQGDWTCLFPNEEVSPEASNPLQAKEKYWFPSRWGSFRLDDIPGEEETLVYLSPGPEPKLDRWARQGRPTEGARDLAGTVSLATDQEPASGIEWYRTIRFHHAP